MTNNISVCTVLIKEERKKAFRKMRMSVSIQFELYFFVKYANSISFKEEWMNSS
jgi:hypothetical protein